MIAAAIALFERDSLSNFLRVLHILAGICWIGLLYYFNVVQVPAFAAYGDEGRARNVSIDKLARRALWWFRWAAVTTFVFGILITGVEKDYFKNFLSTSGDGVSAVASHVAILVGMILGTTMMLNVWGVIWRNQKKVLANAANVLAGGEADPAVAGAGRAALLASRMNFIFSFSMLWFMVASAHIYNAGHHFDTTSGARVIIFLLVAVAIAAVLELLALGFIGGKAATNKLLWIFESHRNAMITGGVLWVIMYALSEILLRK
jgi:uncharacterized membrane protein